jgi:hypothetical protein
MAIQLKNFVLLLLLFSFVKLEIDLINIKNDHFTDSYDDDLELGIKGFEGSYLKIRVEANNGESEDINHIISYYGDENFSERKQLAQSLTNKTVMWLNNEQTKDNFYIRIECSKKPCSYDIYLDKTEVAELELNSQYTYYVTKENKHMDFLILKGHNSTLGDNPYIAVSVRGGKKVEAFLDGGKNEHKDTYYKVKYENFKKEDYYLQIDGEVGDLINVGLILYYDCNSNNCNSDFEFQNGEEISSYLDPAYSEIFRILHPGEINIGYYYEINNKFLGGTIITNKFLAMKTVEESLYYTMQYVTDTTYDGQGNNKYSPLLDGIYNIKQTVEGTTIGLIPMKPRDDFDFLTYEVFPIAGDISVSIYECDNYPLCHLNNIDKTKLKKIDNYQSYYYSFNNKEFTNISPINKKQKMLLITCEEGLTISHLDKRKICSSMINMKTNGKLINNTDFNFALPPYQRYIRKNNVDKYYLRGTDVPIHLNIETVSGDINVKINKDSNKIKNNFYEIDKNEDIEITITAKKNSIYSINNNYHSQEIFSFHIGFNYVMKLEKDKEIALTPNDKIDTLFNNGIKENYQYFFKISPLNCNIKLKSYNNINKLKDDLTLKKNEIFQDKLYINAKHFTVSEANGNDCLLYISSYNMKETISSEYSNGITLGNDTSQTFVFNDVNNQIIFSYAHIELENDVKIVFEQSGEETNEYNYDIKVNKEYLKRGEKFSDGKKVITLKANEIKDQCDSEYMCKILVRVESEDKNIESNLKITVTSANKDNNDDDDNNNKPGEDDDDNKNKKTDNNDDDDDGDDDDDDKKLLTIILLIVGVVVIIGAAIGLYFYFRVYSKNKDLNAAVNQISFKDNDKNNDDDEIGDSLLD